MPIKKTRNGLGIQKKWVSAEITNAISELVNDLFPDQEPRPMVEHGHWEITTAKQRKAEAEWEREVIELMEINTEREKQGLEPLTREQIDAGEHLPSKAELYAQEHAAIEKRKGLS